MSYKKDIKKATEELIELCRQKLSENRHVVITGHACPDSDSLISSYLMKRLLERADIRADVKFSDMPDRVSADNARLLNFYDKIIFGEYSKSDAVLLVDHHKAHFDDKYYVFGCVDHHTTPPSPEYEYNFVEHASSCGKIIYDMMCSLGYGCEESEKLALYSVYLDTQSCKSSKFNPEDAQWVENTLKKYSIDRRKIERMGYCYNNLTESTIEELALCGFKKYVFFGYSGMSTCIQISPEDVVYAEQRLPEIFKYIASYMKKNGIFVCAYVLNMPEKNYSDIYFISPVENFTGFDMSKVSPGRLASRSKDVVPVIYRMAEKLDDKK